MSISFLRVRPFDAEQALKRLRHEAALVRTLLDEVDRIAPAQSVRHPQDAADQLAEEVARLGCRLLECAAAMTGEGGVPSEAATRFPELRTGE